MSTSPNEKSLTSSKLTLTASDNSEILYDQTTTVMVEISRPDENKQPTAHPQHQLPTTNYRQTNSTTFKPSLAIKPTKHLDESTSVDTKYIPPRPEPRKRQQLSFNSNLAGGNLTQIQASSASDNHLLITHDARLDVNTRSVSTAQGDLVKEDEDFNQQNRSNLLVNTDNNNKKAPYSYENIHVVVGVQPKTDHANHLSDMPISVGNQKRATFNDMPGELASDEGVCSPVNNIDYEDDYASVPDYYQHREHDELKTSHVGGQHELADDDDDFEAQYSANDELTNLSRQSMMPLHELIAYYQYIEQGNTDQEARKLAISRNSSGASQYSASSETVQTNYSTSQTKAYVREKRSLDKQLTEKKDCSERQSSSSSIEDLKSSVVPKLVVQKVDDNPTHHDGSSDTTETITECNVTESDQITKQVVPRDKRRVRANVILELINSERDFVKHLKDVVEGYLRPARRHPEIFTGERINTIFSNIEQLYEFQQKFLNDLEQCIQWDDLAASQVGQCFLEHTKGFSVYHYYCNNHPNAISELQDLYTKPRFVKFFEACRLLQNMIDISLDGFLLTPIQKICKYPLQLNELLKNTDDEHPDFQKVADALESMRNCANLANERKRRIEALADVMSFQEKVENWFGPKLKDTSSILIHHGEVSKMNAHNWSQGIQLYLFDHLLLFAKKDLLKRNTLILKGRVSMDTVTQISDADEYKPKRSFKLYCSDQKRWFVFTTRNEKEKDEWIRAFERERNLVESDENEGFQITEREIGVARRALQNRKHSRSARYGRAQKKPDTAVVDQLDLDVANMIMNRTLSLPSCIHPSHVMNFVEDSKVVSGSRKKSLSPNHSNVQSEQQQLQQPQQAEISDLLPAESQTGQTSWFRKMGSKKLSRSQIYNVNGAQSAAASAGKTATISPVISNSLGKDTRRSDDEFSSVNPTATTTTYDELEKRHREHMVSEQQARLFRLNNDIPPPIFGNPSPLLPPKPPSRRQSSTDKQSLSRTDGSTVIVNSFKSLNLTTGADEFERKPAFSSFTADEIVLVDQQQQSSRPPATTRGQQQKAENVSQDAKLPSGSLLGDSGLSKQPMSSLEREQTNPARRPAQHQTFESTVVLSSGKVVRVREDAV